MKQVWLSAMFLVCVGAAAAYADDSSTESGASSTITSSGDDRAAHHAAFHAALESCATENNLTKPEPGTRPNDADREVMDTCLKLKGFNKPPGPPPAPPTGSQAASDS